MTQVFRIAKCLRLVAGARPFVSVRIWRGSRHAGEQTLLNDLLGPFLKRLAASMKEG